MAAVVATYVTAVDTKCMSADEGEYSCTAVDETPACCVATLPKLDAEVNVTFCAKKEDVDSVSTAVCTDREVVELLEMNSTPREREVAMPVLTGSALCRETELVREVVTAVKVERANSISEVVIFVVSEAGMGFVAEVEFIELELTADCVHHENTGLEAFHVAVDNLGVDTSVKLETWVFVWTLCVVINEVDAFGCVELVNCVEVALSAKGVEIQGPTVAIPAEGSGPPAVGSLSSWAETDSGARVESSWKGVV